MDHRTWLLFMLAIISMLIYGTTALPKYLYCYEEFSSGYCKNATLRYYYDQKRKKCDSFVYLGYGGTLNNFATLNECTDACEKNWPEKYLKY